MPRYISSLLGLDKTIKELRKDGVRITVYMNPNLNNQGPLFKEAESNSYLVKNRTGQTYLFNFGEFFCGIVDLTNSDAYQWYKSRSTCLLFVFVNVAKIYMKCILYVLLINSTVFKSK